MNYWLRLLTVLIVSLSGAAAALADDLLLMRTPSTGYQPQFQVAGEKIYYVWHEYDGPYRQIFTAEMSVNGTGWKAAQRTSGRFDKVFPQLHVSGNKIYYVRQQPDETKNRQIWTMEMNIDGTGWKEVQRTNTPFDKQFPELQVVGNKVYYAWNESDGKFRQIWTAEMNIDGLGWRATQRTTTPFDKYEPQIQVVGEKIYLVWRESDGVHFQIWTASMSKEGKDWQAIKRTNTPSDKHNPQLVVNENKIYYAWHEADGPDWRKSRYQIWTAVMNVDGTGWEATKRTFAPFEKYTPQLQVHGEKIYYVWEESDGKHRQIWTAVSNRDGSDWKPRKRTTSPFGKYDPQFQIVGNRIYYVWHEDHGPTEPIWVAWEAIDASKSRQTGGIGSSFENELIEARKISNELMETVRGLLLQEIQKGGLSSAVRVCSELAQEMTNRFSRQTGDYLRRVSSRYRNPKNAPDEYERRKLQEFDRLNHEKKLSDEYAETVEEQGVQYLRYMKPLTVGPLCVTCHGPKENIPPEVRIILKEKYPEDRATGFLVGDLRGAISLKIALQK
jgi:hypothetical protein